MKKFNLISSIISLGLTSLLCICCLLAWFASNTEASVSGVEGYTSDESIDASLEVYLNDAWVKVEESVFENQYPSDVLYFRMNVVSTSSNEETAILKFVGVDSILNTNLVTYSSQDILYNGVHVYTLNTENQVLVQNQVLYKLDSDELVLQDYKIESAYQSYYLGQESAGYTFVEGLPTTMNPINENIAQFVVNAQSEDCLYFALEYHSTDNDNYYMYQTLKIQAVALEVI